MKKQDQENQYPLNLQGFAMGHSSPDFLDNTLNAVTLDNI
jgi:hypothetical protein